MLLPQDIIRIKRDGGVLKTQEIQRFVDGLVDGSFSDAQVGAMAMAIFQNSLNSIYIINIVRPNWNMKSKVGTDLLVSHQGFLLLKEGVPTMIHASTSGKVVQIPLQKYLGWFKNSSTIKGINLLRVNH